MRILPPVLLFALLTFTASAQSRDRSAAWALMDADADVEGGGSVAIRETELSTAYPVWRDTERTVTLGLRWTRHAFDFERSDFGDLTAHAIRVPMRLHYRGYSNWTLMAAFTPGLGTDLERLTKEDVTLGVLLLGHYRWSERLTLTAGAVYNQAFGESRAFPAAGLTWQVADALRVEATFPRPRVVYHAAPRLDVYALFEPSGDQWNLRTGEGDRDLALEQYRAGVGIDWGFSDRVNLVVAAGSVFGRNLEWELDGDTLDRRDLDSAWFVRAGLSFR